MVFCAHSLVSVMAIPADFVGFGIKRLYLCSRKVLLRTKYHLFFWFLCIYRGFPGIFEID